MVLASKEHQQDFLAALLRGDRQRSSQIATGLAENLDEIKGLYEDVIKPSMYAIGHLWENGDIGVATEHVASAIVEGVLNELYAKVASGKHQGRTVVAACVEEEKHQIGIKMVADIFEMHGWNVFFLGADMPCDELIRFMRGVKPDVLALSLSIYFHLPMLEKMLVAIRQEFPALPILVGGQAFRYGGRDVLSQYAGVDYAGDLAETEAWLKCGGRHG